MSDEINRGLDPADDQLARAQHQVRLLEKQVRALKAERDALRAGMDGISGCLKVEIEEHAQALRLRDEAAREHERMRDERDSLRAQLAEVREKARETLAEIHRIAHDFNQLADHNEDRFEVIMAAVDNALDALSPPASVVEREDHAVARCI